MTVQSFGYEMSKRDKLARVPFVLWWDQVAIPGA